MKTGLYFGSFNPIHIGHMAIANYVAEYSDLREIWFVVSPHNPLKSKYSLLPDHHRIRLAELAIGNDTRFRVSDIETKLPRPSYTIDTLTYLKAQNSNREFCLIMGGDNLLTLHKWKNIEDIIREYPLYVYPRKEENVRITPDLELIISQADITLVNAPQMEISGTFIREAVKAGKDIRHFLPPGVWKYIIDMHFYE
ncbi:MAG: nicotinate-nucleotide adenylyltransferase [Bacteroidales bacterium]|nr:nicotinate-nucleotide adenylyltransferase [Bacteroidales bacterium]